MKTFYCSTACKHKAAHILQVNTESNKKKDKYVTKTFNYISQPVTPTHYLSSCLKELEDNHEKLHLRDLTSSFIFLCVKHNKNMVSDEQHITIFFTMSLFL